MRVKNVHMKGRMDVYNTCLYSICEDHGTLYYVGIIHICIVLHLHVQALSIGHGYSAI